MNSKIKRIVICIISIIALVAVDYTTKRWAVYRLKDKKPISIINGVFELYYLPNGNTGAAFGMLKGHQALFLIIAIVICAVLLFVIYNMPTDKRYMPLVIMMTLIISGGFGNMIDRFTLNYVIDFIYFSLINFPIFNVADMYVSVGTVMLVILLLFYYKEEDINKIQKTISSVIKRNSAN